MHVYVYASIFIENLNFFSNYLKYAFIYNYFEYRIILHIWTLIYVYIQTCIKSYIYVYIIMHININTHIFTEWASTKDLKSIYLYMFIHITIYIHTYSYRMG
jgi:hypothetical protein